MEYTKKQTAALCTILRNLAKSIIDAEDQSIVSNGINMVDMADLLDVLARIVDGKSIYQAFGAPGDWGHGTDIGDALSAMYDCEASKIGTSMTPSFTTTRLIVFETDIRISDLCPAPRRFYFAFLRDEDYLCQVVTATIMERCLDFPPCLDWIETGQEHRRKGYATEIFRGIETRIGEKLVADGATQAGIAFCEAME